MRSYQNLEAWKISMKLIGKIYHFTKSYPKEEMFGLTSQTRRAAVSIACNIAEGMGRQYKKDTINFLHISRGSAYEVETLLGIALLANFISAENHRILLSELDAIIMLINGLINYQSKANIK